VAIQILPEDLVNQIAAGEVVERPAHMVKELVENAIDAGATEIEVEVDEGGRHVRVTDNGRGISKDDLSLALSRHATSKIQRFDDLFHLNTYGFRGEALASIAAVSRLSLGSMADEALGGFRIRSNFGALDPIEPIGHQRGTTVHVQELFANVPARMKFLKSESAEMTQIKTVLKALALGAPQVGFRIRSKGELIDMWPATDLRLKRAEGLLGQNTLYTAVSNPGGSRCEVVFSSPHQVAKTAKNIWLFVQGRWVQDRALQAAVLDAYRTLLMHGEYPFAVVWLDCDPEDVDVNVHPTKSQVKFRDPSAAFRTVHHCLRDALEKAPWRPQFHPSNASGLHATHPEHARYVGQNSFPDQRAYAGHKSHCDQKHYAKQANYTEQGNHTEYSNSTEPANHGEHRNSATSNVSVSVSTSQPLHFQDEAFFVRQTKQKNSADSGQEFARELFGSLTPVKRVGSTSEESQLIGRQSPTERTDPRQRNEATGKNSFSAVAPLTATDDASTAIENQSQVSEASPFESGAPSTGMPRELQHNTSGVGFWGRLEVLGQLHLTYILAQSDTSMVIVDQHAAHERVNFEKLMSGIKSGGIERQSYLLPLALDVPPDQSEAILSQKENLFSLGLEIEQTGPSDLVVTARPAFIDDMGVYRALVKLGVEMVDRGGSFAFEKTINDLVATMACHSSVRAGQALGVPQMRELLRSMDQFPLSTFCPHGRPVHIETTFAKMERDFGRIV
jgi:DNA mismatch repair protein MutL